LYATYSASPVYVAVTFDDSPSGEIAVSPVPLENIEGTVQTVPSGGQLELIPGVYSLLAYPPGGFDFTGWNASAGAKISSYFLPLSYLLVTGSVPSATITATFVRAALSDQVAIAAFDPANSTFGGGSVSLGNFLTTHSKANSGSIVVGTYSLVAKAATGYRFGGWYYTPSSLMINFSSSTNVTLENGTLNAPKSIGLIFAIFNPIPVSVTFAATGGPGGAVVQGIGYVGSGDSLDLTPGENYTVSAAPGEGFGFVLWGPPHSTTIWNRDPGIWTELLVVNTTGTVDISYASGLPESLTFHISPVGAGQILFNGDNTYTDGQTNSSVAGGETYLDGAVPAPGFTFSSWTGSGGVTVGVASKSNSTVTVSGSGDLNATFVPTTFPITLITNTLQTVDFVVDGTDYSDGSTIPLAPTTYTVSVSPATGTEFDAWNSTPGAAIETPFSNSTTITVSGPATVTALVSPFAALQPMASPSPVDVGISVNFQGTTSAGTSEIFSALWSGLPPGCQGNAVLSAFACAPTTPGTYVMAVTFTDPWGEPATSSPVTLVVNPLPAITGASISPSTIDVGVSTTLMAAETGGTGPFTWSYEGLPSGCTSTNQDTLTCSPSAAGSYNLTVTVTDSFGEIAQGLVKLVVNPLPSLRASVSQPTAAFGKTVTFTVNLTGGTGPFKLSYAGLPPGCLSANFTSLSCVPSKAGTYQVNVSATDAFGKVASQVVTLVVKPAPPSIWGLSTTWIAIGLVLLVVIAIVVFAVLRRRPKKPTIVAVPSTAPPTSAPPRPAPKARPRPPPPRPAAPEWSEEPPPPNEWQEGK
jgi:hypothetical protein